MNSLLYRILLGFLLSLILSIVPLPHFFSLFRPAWVLLLVLYIEYYLPGRFSVASLLVAGLILDTLLATVIGEHSFALLLVTFCATIWSRRFQFFPLVQQIFLVGFLCFAYQTTITVIDALLSLNYNLWEPLASACVGMIIWPWIRVAGDSYLVNIKAGKKAFL